MTTFKRNSKVYLKNGGIITLQVVKFSLAGTFLDNSVLLLDLILVKLLLRAVGINYGIWIVLSVVLVINVTI